MKPEHPTREEALHELFRAEEETSVETDAEMRAMTAAFDALDEAAPVSLSTERLDAMRELLALEIGDEFIEPSLKHAVKVIETLPREPLPPDDRRRILEGLLSRLTAFLPADEWRWAAVSIASFLTLVSITGIRKVPLDAASDLGVVAPTLFLLMTGAVGMRITRRWTAGALYGVLMAGVAAMALGAIAAGGSSAFQPSDSATQWVQQGLACLALGTATALFSALPFVGIRAGVSLRDGARLGAMGAITGAGVLHAHCPISLLDHTLWHALAIVSAAGIGMIAVLGRRQWLGGEAS